MSGSIDTGGAVRAQEQPRLSALMALDLALLALLIAGRRRLM